MAKNGFIVSFTLCYLSTNVSCFLFDNFLHFMNGMGHKEFGDVTTSKPTEHTSQSINLYTATRSTKALLCYLCSGQFRDGSCSTQWLCKPGEVCAVYHDGQGYSHKCIGKEVCSKASTVPISGCWRCCDTDLCNDRCNATESYCGEDSAMCGVLLSEGYDVCSDPSVAHHQCRKTCGHCSKS